MPTKKSSSVNSAGWQPRKGNCSRRSPSLSPRSGHRRPQTPDAEGPFRKAAQGNAARIGRGERSEPQHFGMIVRWYVRVRHAYPNVYGLTISWGERGRLARFVGFLAAQGSIGKHSPGCSAGVDLSGALAVTIHTGFCAARRCPSRIGWLRLACNCTTSHAAPAWSSADVAVARFSSVTKFITRTPPGLRRARTSAISPASLPPEPPRNTASGSGQVSRRCGA